MEITIEKIRKVISLVELANPPKADKDGIGYDYVSNTEKRLKESAEDSKREGLKNYINGLTAQERAELLAVMMIGRGDLDELPEEKTWKTAFGNAVQILDISSADYITDKAPLAEYLTEGLSKLGLK